MKYGGAGGKNVRDAEKKFAVVRRRLICCRNLRNGCEQPVLRSEKSRGWVGAVGSDAASSAQSKRVKGGETARFGGVWGVLGVRDIFLGCCTGSSLVRRRSRAAGGGPGLGRAGDVAIIDDDVAALC